MGDHLPLRTAAELVGEQLEAILTTGSCTTGFLRELAFHLSTRTYHVGMILDEIAILEGSRPGPSRTQKKARFGHEPLRGLWHKHHFQPRFMARNVMLEADFEAIVVQVLERHGVEVGAPDIAPQPEQKLKIAADIAHTTVFGGYESRSRRQALTGEWIVFRRNNDRNHYLTLASHNEGGPLVQSRNESDRVIKERIERYEREENHTDSDQISERVKRIY